MISVTSYSLLVVVTGYIILLGLGLWLVLWLGFRVWLRVRVLG